MAMQRKIYPELLEWKSRKNRKPLLLRGARQVGKTHILRIFGKEQFSNYVEIDFELQPRLKPIFNDLEPSEIIRNLSLSLNAEIIEGKTLLILDEVQECPRAIMALRYFYEKMPGLHVIAAGSLLEFTLHSQAFKMPVGRVEYLFMKPLSFSEFLQAQGEERLRNFLSEFKIESPPHEAVHNRLMALLKEYLIVGGMPASVNAYIKDGGSLDFQRAQNGLLQTYRDDFGKYASQVKHGYLDKVFATAPALVGQKYKYVNVDRELRSRDLRSALELLCRAGVIHKIHSTSGHGLPLSVHRHDGVFKILFLDIGLMQRACGLDAQIALNEELNSINAGALAEQLVGQELLSHSDPYVDEDLYFWIREKKTSQAEVDYLWPLEGHILPIEVKAGATGRLRSLKIFMEEHGSPLGIRFSQQQISLHEQVLSLPLYAVEEMPRLAKTVLSNGV